MVSPLQETSLFHSQNIVHVRFKHLTCGKVSLWQRANNYKFLIELHNSGTDGMS